MLEEQRQKVFDSARRDAVAHVLVDIAPGRIALEGFAKARAKARPAGFVQRKLARGQQAHFLHLVNGSLRIDVESADGFDFLVEQIDAVRQGAAHREQIDESAAHAILARGDHLSDVAVAGQRQLRAQLRQAELLFLLEEEGIGGEVGRRRQTVERGARRNQRHVAAAAADRVQGGEALGDQVVVRRERVVGQRLPVGQQIHRQRGLEIGNFLEQTLRVQGGGAQHDQGLRLGGQARERQEHRRSHAIGYSGAVAAPGSGL